MMNIDQLREVLSKFADLYARNSDPSRSDGLKRLASALEPHDKKTVKSFVKATVDRRTKALNK